jgi:DNA-directed RNA polymerase specialized sigma24 family protein
MTEAALTQALPVVQDLAARKANGFVRRCGLAPEEREDVQSQLLLCFLTSWRVFDGEKASVRTFASRVMDRELASILRYRFAECRQLRDLPVSESTANPATVRHFRVDLDRAILPLPAVIQETVGALQWLSASQAAAALGCSRQMISRRKRVIRDAFLSAGIGPDYFVAGGSR